MVTTPSDVSLEDARKAVHMFNQVKVPILGIVENMSYLVCPHCNERVDVFSTGGGERTAREMKVNFLGALPLDPAVRAAGDTGKPAALRDDSVFRELAQRTLERIRAIGPPVGPKIDISE